MPDVQPLPPLARSREIVARLRCIPPFVIFGDLRRPASPEVYVSACAPPVGMVAKLAGPTFYTYRWDAGRGRWYLVDAVVRAARPLTEEEIARGRLSRTPMLFRCGSHESRQGIWTERAPQSLDEFIAQHAGTLDGKSGPALDEALAQLVIPNPTPEECRP